MQENEISLTDVLGQTSSKVKAGEVEFIVRPLKLGQFEAAQEIIAEVLASSRVQKEVQEPGSDRVYKFTDTDLMQGFLSSRGQVERFLSLCVEIKQPVESEPLALADVPLNIAAQLLRECLRVNEDFFEQVLALIIDVVGKIGKATEAVGAATAEATKGLDLAQQGKPIGERLPQLYSAPGSSSEN